MTAARAAPGWRPLGMTTALVVLAHVLVLKGAPAQFGQLSARSDGDELGSKPFTTRQIVPPAAPAQPVAAPPPPRPRPAAVARVPAPPADKSTPSDVNNKLYSPSAEEIRALAATESIANTNSPSATVTATVSDVVDLPPERAAALPASATPGTSAAASSPASTATTQPPTQPTTQVTAVSLPGSVRLQYNVVGQAKGLNYQAKSELLYQTSGDTYEAVVKVSAFLIGSRSLVSVGRITASGLAPTRFADRGRQELAAHFEPAKGKIVFSANTPDAPWAEGAQDRVSVFLQLVGIVAAKPESYPPGASVSLYTVGPRDAETWTFEVEQPETLDLLGAPLATLKLTRKPRREFDQKVELWLAPSLGYLPVRNRVTNANGDFVDQLINEVSRS